MNQPMKHACFPAKVRHDMVTVWLTLLLLLAIPFTAVAQTLEWDPLWMDIGQVPIGETAYGTLTLSNSDADYPLTVSNVELTYNQQGQFAITVSEALPAVLLPGGSMDVVFIFSPIAWSFAMADIIVTNDSTNAPSLYYSVMAMGVEGDICSPLTNCGGICVDTQTDGENCGSCGNVCLPVANATVACVTESCTFTCDEGYEPVGDGCEPIVAQTPLEMLQDLIAYANSAIADGTLVGFALGDNVTAAEGRRGAFMNMLSEAEELLTAEEIGQACGQLNSAQIRTDGGYPFRLPPDFVVGDASYVIYDELVEILNVLSEMYPSEYSCVLREANSRPR